MTAFSRFEHPQLPSESESIHWYGVGSHFRPSLIADIAREREGLLVVVTSTSLEANQLEDSLRFYMSDYAGHVMRFPDWETLVYDAFSPHEDIVSDRLKLLSELQTQSRGILITPVSNLLQKLVPVSFVASNQFSIKVGDQLDLQRYRSRLDSFGYRFAESVFEHGEYAIRGSIIDVFPMGSHSPIRIELFDDEVESLRLFDTESQRSSEKLERFETLPAAEYPWDDASRSRFQEQWKNAFPTASNEAPLLADIKGGNRSPGIEYYAPLFFDDMGTLFDYLPHSALFVLPENLEDQVQSMWDGFAERYEQRRHDILRPILSPEHLFLRKDQLFQSIKTLSNLYLCAGEPDKSSRFSFENNLLRDLATEPGDLRPLRHLKASLMESPLPTALVVESDGRREIMIDYLKQENLAYRLIEKWADFGHASVENDKPISLVTGRIFGGFVAPGKRFQVVSEFDIFKAHVSQARRRKADHHVGDAVVSNLTELPLDSAVVHFEHGIGRYKGLETISVGDSLDEFLTIEYADGAKLYVPVASLHLITRYSGTDSELAPLHRLGTDKWTKAKAKALEKIRDTAADLLEIYAKRQAKKGFEHEIAKDGFRAFCDKFPFEETPDQLSAIQSVIGDMTGPNPMDRLVCGDVGFGKTEVAMRAAYIAVHSGKQVAVLVPTTLLAQQHYESFLDRFADTGAKVAVLSRFKTQQEQTKALNDLKSGVIDIVIGTHKLIQPDVQFNNLGLLIIDEEHRFGVKQKEMLKAYRAEVDVLTMTATPIPRTLNMAMGSIRDLSIIATPPAKRLSVKTFVNAYEDNLVQDALARELSRGGQVYYLYNEVKTIERAAERIQALMPQARVAVAHGQMRERELEQVMSDFYHQRHNILVCTTIIETGIDVPNANTIIIERADKFGLAQLHQLRGRVGRSHHQAYAYLLTSPDKRLDGDALKRLEAIEHAQDLGAGFTLATHDLEIRGAGELLGDEQSGQIQSIGFNLYMELLEQAVQSLRSGKTIEIENQVKGCEMNLRVPAIIPDAYLPDVHSRLVLYKRIANSRNETQLKDIQVEMIDRYGLLPESCKILFRQAQLKLLADEMGIEKVEASESGLKLTISEATEIKPITLVQLIQKRPDLYRMDGSHTFRYQHELPDPESKLAKLESVLEALGK